MATFTSKEESEATRQNDTLRKRIIRLLNEIFIFCSTRKVFTMAPFRDRLMSHQMALGQSTAVSTQRRCAVGTTTHPLIASVRKHVLNTSYFRRAALSAFFRSLSVSFTRSAISIAKRQREIPMAVSNLGLTSKARR